MKKLLFGLLILCAAPSAHAAPAYKQKCLQDTAMAGTATCTMPGATAAHDSYLVCVGVDNNSSSATPSDTEGNTFVLKLGPTATAGNEVQQSCWFVTDAIGGTTDQFSDVTGDRTSFYVIDCSACAYWDTINAQQAQATGVVSSPTVSTTVATELQFGIGSTKTSQNGFTSYDGTNFANHIDLGTQVTEYQNVSSLQVGLKAQATTGATTPAVMAIIALAAAGPSTSSNQIPGRIR